MTFCCSSLKKLIYVPNLMMVLPSFSQWGPEMTHITQLWDSPPRADYCFPIHFPQGPIYSGSFTIRMICGLCRLTWFINLYIYTSKNHCCPLCHAGRWKRHECRNKEPALLTGGKNIKEQGGQRCRDETGEVRSTAVIPCTVRVPPVCQICAKCLSDSNFLVLNNTMQFFDFGYFIGRLNNHN